MIILKRLYSETNLFDEITFKTGINIVIARLSEKNQEKPEDYNGVGKTDIIRLIDFAFLSKSSMNHFNQKKYFNILYKDKHTFTVEFIVNNEVYCIKRMFDKKLPIWLKKNDEKYIAYDEDELKVKLANLFFMNDDSNLFVEQEWFRNLIHFFIKTDLNKVKQPKPIDFISDGKFKPKDLMLYALNFFLLGLPNSNLVEFDKVTKEISQQKSLKNSLIKNIEDSTNKELKEYESGISKIEKNISLLEQRNQEFTFIDNYQNYEDELKQLSNKISDKLFIRNKLLKEQNNYEKSYEVKLDADLEKVEKIYNELDTELSAFIKKTLSEVKDFRKTIAENRKHFLQKRQAVIKEDLEKTLNEIVIFEKRRTELLNYLNEQKALDSLKNSYKELIEEKSKLEKNKALLHEIKDIELKISRKKSEQNTINTKIIEEFQKIEAEIKQLRDLFFDIVKNTVFVNEKSEGLVFHISAKSGSKPINFDLTIPKRDSETNNFFELITYDFTVFFNLINKGRNLPFFLIHDGVYKNLSLLKRIKTLNYINSLALQNSDFQYIIFANEHELKISNEDKEQNGDYDFDLFSNLNIRKILYDTPDKMFFKESFS